MRYHPWLDEQPGGCSVTVHCGADARPVRRPSPTASFGTDGVCLVTAPGYRGTIAPDVRSAHLELTAPNADDVDYFLRAVLALLAYELGGLLIHASALLRQGRAFVFSGRSGIGKSTTVRVSAGLADTVALGDDLILLQPGSAGWVVCGTPFWNPETPERLRQAQTSSGPLAALLRLTQDNAVFVRKLGTAEAVAALLSDLPVVPLDGRRVPTLLARLGRLVGAVPVGELHFRPDSSLWSAVDGFLQETG